MSNQIHIGYLFHNGKCWQVNCKSCGVPESRVHKFTKFYRENVGDYKQNCHECNRILVVGKTSKWCELYAKSPSAVI